MTDDLKELLKGFERTTAGESAFTAEAFRAFWQRVLAGMTVEKS